MSINVVTTTFTNVKTNKHSFGFRIYSDIFMSYDNTFYKNINEAKEDEPLRMLNNIINNPNNDDICELLELIEKLHLNIRINDEEYSWNEIKHLF